MAKPSVVVKSRAISEYWWFSCAVLALCIGLAWLIAPGLGAGISPEGERTITAAKHLAQSPYGDWFVAFCPPFLHVVISGVTLKIFGDGAALYNMQFCWYALSVVLVYWLTHRQVREPYALMIAILYALAPATLSALIGMGSQLLFMVTSLMGLITIDLYFGTKKPELVSEGRLFLCGLWVVLSVLTSHWGYALMLTYWIMVLRLHDLKKSMVVLFGMALALIPFYLWSGLYGGSPLPAIQNPGWDQLLSNTAFSILGTIKLQFAGLGEYDFSRWFWVRWMVGGFMLLGLMLGLMRHSGVGCVYLATVLVIMYGLLGEKNLFPVLPFLILYLYFGVMRFGEWMKQMKLPVSKVLSPMLTLLILAASATHWINGAATRMTAPDTSPALTIAKNEDPRDENINVLAMASSAISAPPRIGRSLKEEPAPNKAVGNGGYERAIHWMRLNTSQGDTIGVSRMTKVAPFYPVNRALIVLPIVSSPSQLADRLGRYDFVVEQKPEASVPYSAMSGMDAVSGLNRPLLSLVYNDPENRIRIWRVNKP